jgi:CheY-like chemotaxis protein
MDVLLVEDSPDDVFLTQEAFEDAAVEVHLHVARDGEEAMDFLRDESHPRPDLILLDLNMPRKDGREVLIEVRDDPRLTDIPIVVLTTSSSDEDILAAYQAHVNSYVRKPVTFDRFAEAVRALGDYWFRLVTLPDADRRA